jgi:hypothetical protein
VRLVRRVLDFLGSFGLACALLLNLFLLTLFGTLYQVEGGLFEAQKRYFESWLVVQRDPIPLILPGGLPCMGLLAVNLLVGGLVRIRKSARTAGVIVIHVGIALMLAAAFVKQFHSDDGHLTLYEGERSDEFVSYHLWEVAVWDASQQAEVVEHLIPHAELVDLAGDARRTFTSPALPFDLELSGFLPNCRPLPKGPMWQAESPVVEGYALEQMDEDKEAERNLAGVTARFRERATGNTREDILWGVEYHPATFEAGGKTWAISLRHKRYSMPFTIRLEDFRKEDHPGMKLARSFESDVTKLEGGAEQTIRIQMNEPLRHGGLVLFQSSYGPSDARPEDRFFSVFSVVRNPSDHWPLYSCIVIAVGLLMAFLPKLYRFVRAQSQMRARTEGTS